MAYISFMFRSGQSTQTWRFDDELSSAPNPGVTGDGGNPHLIGTLNDGDVSGPLQCWAASDGTGTVTVFGDRAARLVIAIPEDGYLATY